MPFPGRHCFEAPTWAHAKPSGQSEDDVQATLQKGAPASAPPRWMHSAPVWQSSFDAHGLQRTPRPGLGPPSVAGAGGGALGSGGGAGSGRDGSYLHSSKHWS